MQQIANFLKHSQDLRCDACYRWNCVRCRIHMSSDKTAFAEHICKHCEYTVAAADMGTRCVLCELLLPMDRMTYNIPVGDLHFEFVVCGPECASAMHEYCQVSYTPELCARCKNKHNNITCEKCGIAKYCSKWCRLYHEHPDCAVLSAYSDVRFNMYPLEN